MSFDEKTILVVGGTGFLGQPVVHALDHFGFPVRILSRDSEKVAKTFGNQFEIARGDFEDEKSLLSALDSCYGVHINLKGGPSAAEFDRIEHQGTAKIVKAANASGVKRVTYLSGASVSEEHTFFPAIRAKYNAEKAVIKSGLEYAIFRATWFMESLPLFVKGKQATIMGKQPLKLHWLAASDYAKMVARAFMLDDPPDGVFPVFGPEAYTFREAFEIYTGIIDPDIKITQVPIGVLRFFAAIMFSRELKAVLPLMKYFETNGELGDPATADELLGEPDTTLETWCKLYKETLSK